MIYLITGVPGSGKSLYAVSTLLRKLMAEKVRHENGTEFVRRLVVDNIPQLLLPHELMATRPEGVAFVNGKQAEILEPEGHGLWNWWEWCKPGDILASDEVQRHWRPRGMGTKVPQEIAMLETHRHLGVDFVLITQNAMLLDQNVRRLVGRHLHVRRIFGGGRALIYDWDGCQTDTTRTQGASRTLWSYPRDAFKLYKSSELHTKQQQKIPIWFAFPLVVVALGAFAGPKAYDAMNRSMTGKGVTATATPLKAAPGTTTPTTTQAPALAASAAMPAAASTVALVKRPKPLGCIHLVDRCECFDAEGDRIEVEPALCLEGSTRTGYVLPAPMAGGHDGRLPGYPANPPKPGQDAKPTQPVAPGEALSSERGPAARTTPLASSS